MDLFSKKKISLINDYKNIFSTPHGHRVLMDLCHHCHIFSSTFKGEKPLELAFAEGERETVLRILSFLNLDTLKLIKEYETHLKNIQVQNEGE